MAKPAITRTFGPIHFEDLDAHRFEDLVRELIYDYKDWQSIEATGRSGNDAGFDIRAYERTRQLHELKDDEEDFAESHPMHGNQWMIQCKREKEIGPKAIEKILEEVDGQDPPYGYILAAAANFSRKSYDAFREALLKKGVMEFHLWGKPELEDMLHQPKNDRILFTFFGVSLVSRRRSRATEIRSAVTNKNKIYRIFGDDIGKHNSVLIRDSQDTHYPYKDEYRDFKDRPRWNEYFASEYYPLGLIVCISEFFAYFDIQKKEYDFSPEASLMFRENISDDERQEQHEKQQSVRDFWEHLPRRNQATFHRDGLVRFDEMLVIDDKGDVRNKFPHIFVDFQGSRGPFSSFYEYIREGSKIYGSNEIHGLRDWKRIRVFPKSFSKNKRGKIYKDKSVTLDEDAFKSVKHGHDYNRNFFDLNSNYEFLNPRDIISVANTDPSEKEKHYIQITHSEVIAVSEYLKEFADEKYAKGQLERRIGREVTLIEKVTIYEFKKVYEWELERKT